MNIIIAGEESGVTRDASALRAMHLHGEIVKIKSRDGQGIQSAKWRRKV